MDLIKVTSSEVLTMSSREISELVESRHDNVKRAIERLANAGVIKLPPLEEVKNQAGQVVKEYQINKRDSYVVVAQLSPVFTARLVDRWQELENKEAANQAPHFEIPQTLPDALRLAAQLAEEKQQALEKIKIKDQLLVAVADLNIRAGDIPVGQFAKNLAIKELGPNNMFKWLRARGFLRDNNEPYQPYVNRGYFNWKPYDEKINGEVKHQTMITPRGQAWVTRMIRTEYELGDSA
jgi:phage regulator Rha-like protein